MSVIRKINAVAHAMADRLISLALCFAVVGILGGILGISIISAVFLTLGVVCMLIEIATDPWI